MSRKYRPYKRRRSQAFPEEEENVVPGEANGVQDVVQDPNEMAVDAPDSAQAEKLQVDDADGREQPEESEEERKRKQELWEVFQEERHEGTSAFKTTGIHVLMLSVSVGSTSAVPAAVVLSHFGVGRAGKQYVNNFLLLHVIL